MTKKYKYLIILIFFFTSKGHALSPKYVEELYVGCFKKSIAYIGLDQAKVYCPSTIDKLNKKFTDKKIDEVFSKESDEIMQLTKFATIVCEK